MPTRTIFGRMAMAVAVCVTVSDAYAQTPAPRTEKRRAVQTKRSQLASPFMVIVEGLGAAGIALGDSSKEITEKYGEPVIGSSEDPVYLTYYNSGMEFSLKGDKVIAIFLYAAQSNRSGTYYKYPGTTKKGIGPKSREEDVVKKYGKPDKIAGETYYYSRLGIAFDFDKIKRVELIRIFPPEGV